MAYDMNTDYAAEMKKTTDPNKLAQLKSARNEKIAAMNSAGGGTNKYNAEATYNYTPKSSGGGSTSGGASTSSYAPKGTYNDQDLNASDLAKVKEFQAAWAAAQAAGDQAGMDAAHQGAESIRSGATYVTGGQGGYSGGVDGSQFIQLTPEQQQLQAETISSVDSIMGGYKQLQDDARQMGNEGLMALAAQWDSMVTMLDEVESRITGQITGQMSGTDPAMQNAIRLIREEADSMRKQTLEELNARGLVQSGVYARALSDMNNSELNQIQSAVASRFGDLQTQLNNAIMTMAQIRVSALGANQNAVNSMMMNTTNNVMNAGLAGMNSAVTMRGQDMQNSQFNQQLGQDQRQFDSTMQYNYAGLNQNQRQFDSTMQFNRDQLSQQDRQFYDQLSQENKQFYAQLGSSERMGYAQIAATKGAQSAADQLARDKFEWEKSTYNTERTDLMNAQNQQNTFNQVGGATSNGGFVENAIKQITSGQASMSQIQQFLSNSGYTPQAERAILDQIKANPSVQKVINGTGTTQPIPGSSYVPSYWGAGLR